eukprot:5144709-Pyramimonas_sp.AAC.1
MLKQLRGQARLASKCPQRGTCATVAIRISFGARRDPPIWYLRHIVGAFYFRVLGEDGLAAK